MAHVYITHDELAKLTNIPDIPNTTFVGEIKAKNITWKRSTEFVDKMVTVTAQFVKQVLQPTINIVEL
jgi:hypothetical protein